ncbi:hypothetical protein G7Y79_00001g003730 [Physcia stellaris]|nr:hypothetical protein G7Y79_00001g003730 [Physcia stellaris]
MPATTVESQFTFLISCIRHADNGKVDFEKVAKECDIISKGAAAKRYERLMKANGIHQAAQSSGGTATSSLKRKATAESSNKGKKRTIAESESQDNTGDDDEGLSKGKAEPKEEPVKKERRKSTVVKQEEPEEVEMPQYDGADDGPVGGMVRYSDAGDYQEDKKGLFASLVTSVKSEDENEGKLAGSGYLGSGAFGSGSAEMGVGENKRMNDSIVIAD